MSDGQPLGPGATVDGFRVEGELGRGASGVVYRAREIALDRPVALKLLTGSVPGTQEHRRFEREARVLAGINHPNVVTLYRIGTVDGQGYIAMRLIQGASLEQFLDGEAPDTRRLTRLLRDVALGLAEVHRQGLVHRDLKPANILIGEDGQAVLTDFGLAHLRAAERLTLPGLAIGSPGFMSPEQAAGESHRVGPAADLYALGVIGFLGLTGRLPFEDPLDTHQMLNRIVTGPTPHALDANPQADPALAAICRRAMAKHPLRRYRDATALAEDLQRALDGQPVLARPGRRLLPLLDRVALPLSTALLALMLGLLAGRLTARARPGAVAVPRGQASTVPPSVPRGTRSVDPAVLLDARSQLASGRPEAALRRLAPALARQPDDLELRLLRARARAATGDRPGALVDLDHVLAAMPARAPARRLRARLRLAAGRLAEAEADARAALTGGDPVPALRLLAEALERQARPADARRIVDRLLARVPDDRRARTTAARLALADDDPSAARTHADHLCAPDATLTILAARAELALGQPDGAARRLLAHRPTTALIRLWLARAQEQAGRPADALGTLRAIRPADLDATSRRELGRAMARLRALIED